jgi:hypothetical protein
MKAYEIYKGFLNKKVNIGIPHWFNQGKLFFFTGYVIEVNNEFLILKTSNGIRKISLSDIIEIKECNNNCKDFENKEEN